ncbi:cytochrome P450 [Dasania marina]|uniref:cytochrome P450 n=1 Tax=Dasania marina TaxID=471499 RepID=UPI000366FF0A|nr:cytochrome P450 [Dasania marina]
MNIKYNPFDEKLLQDPWPTYHAMRDQDPVYYIEEFDAWALTRFDDIWQASLDKTHYTASHGTSPEVLLLDKNLPPKVFLFMDPPEHRQHRNLIAAPYTPMNIATLEQQIRETTRAVMAPSLEKGELDVYRLSSHVALHTIAKFIGLSFEQIFHIRKLIDAFYHREPGRMGTTEKGQQAFAEAHLYIHELIKTFRKTPPAENTHIYNWLNADVNDTVMSDDEIFFSIFALVITGSDTLPMTVAATLYYLSQQPAVMNEVRASPELIPQAFAEAARIDQPTNILGRVVTEDFELHGKQLKKGQPVLFLYASANRDDREFENPDEYQLHRLSKRNLSFGAGLHFCLGQHLARFEGQIILEEIFASLGDFEVDRAKSTRAFGEFLQGFNHLPIYFAPQVCSEQ